MTLTCLRWSCSYDDFILDPMEMTLIIRKWSVFLVTDMESRFCLQVTALCMEETELTAFCPSSWRSLACLMLKNSLCQLTTVILPGRAEGNRSFCDYVYLKHINFQAHFCQRNAILVSTPSKLHVEHVYMPVHLVVVSILLYLINTVIVLCNIINAFWEH